MRALVTPATTEDEAESEAEELHDSGEDGGA